METTERKDKILVTILDACNHNWDETYGESGGGDRARAVLNSPNVAAFREQLEADRGARNQIDLLANFIMHECEGYPNGESGGAGDCAIQIIKAQAARVDELEAEKETLIQRCKVLSEECSREKNYWKAILGNPRIERERDELKAEVERLRKDKVPADLLENMEDLEIYLMNCRERLSELSEPAEMPAPAKEASES